MKTRGIRAIIGSFFRKRGQMGAQASLSSLFATIGFIVVLMCSMTSFMLLWFPYHLYSDEVYNVVVVNAPDSFVEYNGLKVPEIRKPKNTVTAITSSGT